MSKMQGEPPLASDFRSRLMTAIDQNIANEKFGVSELADAMHMSRSNLLRKVKKDTGLSVSQLINQTRLRHAMDILLEGTLNVSEVSRSVGFSSTSYFIKCFREHYGYPPGEALQRSKDKPLPQPDPATTLFEPETIVPQSNRSGNWKHVLATVGLLVLLVAAALFVFQGNFQPADTEKSIAVLPFKNDSNDSSNVYLISGLMDATLSNLQQIEGLRVVSRTTAEKYRNTSKTITELSKELDARYFVEGSGQKIGDRIVLNIQLIDGVDDKHIWSHQYRKDAKDIFELQEEIARNIAQEIEVIITPQAARRIGKKPTRSVEAYEHYLKGKDLFYQSTSQSLAASIPMFRKAIELDNGFALAYANAAMVYYYLDLFSTEKVFGLEINSCADRAMEIDSGLLESLIAKALAHAHAYRYKKAVPLLEKAHELDPTSGLVVHFLSEFYNLHVPNTTRYLEYSLKGVKLDIMSHDSMTTSFKYLHLSNALIQSGFLDEGIRFVNRSLAYQPENVIAQYARVWFIYAKNRDLQQAKNTMLNELSQDSVRMDVLQETAKIFYFLRDYKTAEKYYENFIELQDRYHVDIFKHEHIKLAYVFRELGKEKRAAEFANSFKKYADRDSSIYHHMNQAAYYAYIDDRERVLSHIKSFAEKDDFQYWLLLYDTDPIFDNVKDLPGFREQMEIVEKKFWRRHEILKKSLVEKGLL